MAAAIASKIHCLVAHICSEGEMPDRDLRPALCLMETAINANSQNVRQ